MPACAILSAACKVEECDFVKSVRDNSKETKYGDATRSGKTWFLTLATTEAKNFHSHFLSLLCAVSGSQIAYQVGSTPTATF